MAAWAGQRGGGGTYLGGRLEVVPTGPAGGTQERR